MRVNGHAGMDGASRSPQRGSARGTSLASAKFVRLAQLRKLRTCEQAAAVCYRVRSGVIEFLLVRTNSGHWTFPKGHAEPGLTHAQVAALEAFEEAGVHGRMEEAAFTHYVRRKRAGSSRVRSREKELAVSAHLCEVTRLEPPPESYRNPTWFSPSQAKRRLAEDRAADFAAELARVVDRAVSRIRRQRYQTAVPDAPPMEVLQKVQVIDGPRDAHRDAPRPALLKARAAGSRESRSGSLQIELF